MGPVVYERERRSARMFKHIRVAVSGKNKAGKRFREAAETIVISADGGMLHVAQPLEIDVFLVLTSPFAQEEQECRVAYLGDDSEEGQHVGVEFLTPAPHFWGVDFKQPD